MNHICLYSRATEHHCPLAGTHFTIPRRVEGWVDLGDGLRTEIKCRRRESNPDTVTHPSTNRVQRRLTSLIKTNALPLHQTATEITYTVWVAYLVLMTDDSRVSSLQICQQFHTDDVASTFQHSVLQQISLWQYLTTLCLKKLSHLWLAIILTYYAIWLYDSFWQKCSLFCFPTSTI